MVKIPYKIYDIYGQEHKTLNNKRAQFSISLQAAIFLNSSAVKPVEVTGHVIYDHQETYSWIQHSADVGIC